MQKRNEDPNTTSTFVRFHVPSQRSADRVNVLRLASATWKSVYSLAFLTYFTFYLLTCLLETISITRDAL